MIIQIRAYDVIRDRLSKAHRLQEGRMELLMPDDSTVSDLIGCLDLSDKWVGLVTVNGRLSNPDQILEEGDSIELFSPMVGG